jgi:hypothetical protein
LKLFLASDQYQITNASNPTSTNTTSDDDDNDDDNDNNNNNDNGGFRFREFFDGDHYFLDLFRRYDRDGNYR